MPHYPVRPRLPAPVVSSSIARLQPLREEFSTTFTLFDINSVYEQEEFHGIIPSFIRLVKRVLKVVALLSISLISYHVFYISAMPSFSVSVPIHFDYTGAPACSSLTTYETDKGTNENAHSSPWASSDLFARHHWDSLETEDIIPTPHTSQRLLVANRAYFMELLLVLPESEINRDSTGIFGVKVELASHNGTVLAVSRRSARFPHQSQWINTLQKLVLLVPLMVGALDESKFIVVSAFRDYVESNDHPLRHVHIRIMPQQSAKALVEITKAEIRMGKEFNAFQNALRDWYFTCYAIGTFVIMTLYALVWMIVEKLQENTRRRLHSELAYEFSNNNEGDIASGDGSPRESEHGTFRRSDEFSGTDNPSDQDSEWDDIFYDVPAAAGPDDSRRQSSLHG